MSHRVSQVNNLLQKEIAEILSREVEAKDFGLISVTKVETVKSLQSARVYVRALKHNHRLLEYLNKRVKFIQGLLMDRVELKKVPKITFYVDEATEHVVRIEELIEQEEKKMGEN